MIRAIVRFFRLAWKLNRPVDDPKNDLCPWCFAAMSEHAGGVECRDALQVECTKTLDVRQQAKDGREMGGRGSGEYPTQKAKRVYPPPRPWHPYTKHTED